MPCNYTLSANLIDCKDSMGGVREIYLIDYNNVTTLSLSGSSEIITGITLSGATKFVTIQLRKQVASLTTTINTDDASGMIWYSNEISFNIPKLSATKRMMLQALSVGNLAAIVRDSNNTYWYLGFDNPVTLTAGTAVTGTAYGDANQYTYTLTNQSAKPAYNIVSGLMTTTILDGNQSR